MILYHGSFGKDATDNDLVVGGVANDKVFNTVELFFDGLIDKAEAIKRLRYEKPNVQICFRTERAPCHCVFCKTAGNFTGCGIEVLLSFRGISTDP